MKIWITVLGLSAFLATTAYSQSSPDSASRQHRQRLQKGFVDENGDGINDRQQQRQERKHRRTDRFVDSNGDGICDTRECGVGFRRTPAGNNESAKQSGRKGQGKKQ